MSLKLTELVTRPGAGKAGKPVRVRANFFEVASFITSNVFHYDVTIDPPSAPPAVYRKVWKAFEDSNGQGILVGIKTIYDGRKNVFSPKALPLGEENAKQFEVNLLEQDSKRAGNSFKIRIKKAGEVNMEELRRFLNSQSACTSNCLTGSGQGLVALQVLSHKNDMCTFVKTFGEDAAMLLLVAVRDHPFTS
ncbi:hypothetical protein G6F43_001845 [Rhizopus delemar]|nr:hypothetical protein G6F43_001845 [Rhizopus delemar]